MDILAPTVSRFVHLTVNLVHVDTRTDGVLSVLQIRRLIIVPQVLKAHLLIHMLLCWFERCENQI